MLRECETTKNEMQIEEFLNEEGKGLEIMKKIGQERERKEIGK